MAEMYTGPVDPTIECIVREAARQHLAPVLLLAVMRTEGGKAGTVSANKNKTHDLGHMQINTLWLPEISRLTGLPSSNVAHVLANHGCSNVATGAWLLRKSINAAGDTWKGVAWYHSRTPQHGHPYAWRVYRNLEKIMAESAAAAQRTAPPQGQQVRLEVTQGGSNGR